MVYLKRFAFTARFLAIAAVFSGPDLQDGRSGDHLAAMLGRPQGGPISEVTRERTYSFTTA